MTKQQQHKICAELALRTGSYFWFVDSSPESDGDRWLSTRELMARSIKQYPTVHETYLEWPIDWKISDIPDYFTNAADNRAMVEWMAADDARWIRFINTIRYEMIWESKYGHPNHSMTMDAVARILMTAPLETITLAAAKAMGIEVEAK